MATDVDGASIHPPAGQEYIGSLSPLTLMEFRNHIFNPTYITNNAAKFLDYEWVDIALLREYVQHTAANSVLSASMTRSSRICDPVHVKLESVAPAVKAEPEVQRVAPV
ncbi:hypothetical protein B0H14DRAFT_2629504 [Mycena olivaceomarginata]|nr:hypothetical protein B0H14DRAFT_2629504 [Mycena olivaceomarginata]